MTRIWRGSGGRPFPCGGEGALAADSISSTIAAIRANTDSVTSEIDEVERGFGKDYEQMARFRSTATRFAQSFEALRPSSKAATGVRGEFGKAAAKLRRAALSCKS